MKCGLERRAIIAVTTTAAGTVNTAIKASNGEIHSIIARMPNTVNTAFNS